MCALCAWALDYDLRRVGIEIPSHAALGFSLIGRLRADCWPAPEVTQNLNTTIGRLGLTDKEEDRIVAFLKALTGGI